jgi:hypothetical protein
MVLEWYWMMLEDLAIMAKGSVARFQFVWFLFSFHPAIFENEFIT